MRYERQVVLEMQPGTAAPVVGEQQQAPGTDAAKPAGAAARGSSPQDKGAASSRVAGGTHGSPAKSKAVAKPGAKAKKPAAKKSAAGKPGAAGKQSAGKRGVSETGSPGPTAPMLKADGESFWVHPKRSATEAGPGSSIEVKYHPPQVVHP
jgi:hypothetical protein